MPRLIAPTTALHASWLESRDEWGSGVFQSGSGMSEKLDLDSADGFASWVAVLHQRSDPTTPAEPGFVPATYWWIVEDDTYLGAITLRHQLNDSLLEAGGHIGYGVRPSARRQGLASWALGEVLRRARGLGLSRVLVTCDDDNVGSARTIEKNGGVLEDVRDTTLGRTRRYWIAV
jgi:predicted acetyltransferase